MPLNQINQSNQPTQEVKAKTTPKPAVTNRLFKGAGLSLNKILLLLISMVCVTLLTFCVTALLSGEPARFTAKIRSINNSEIPSLSVQVEKKTKKIKAIPDDLAPGIISQLTQITDNSVAMASLLAKQESPIMSILNHTDYKPIQINTQQAFGEAMAFSQEPTLIKLFLHFNGKDIVANSLAELQEFNPNIDGPCYVLLEAYWAADKSWQKDRSGLYSFVINYDRPAKIELNATEFDPGELLVIYAQYLTTKDKNIKVKGDLPISLQFARYNDQEMIALVPLSYDLPAGQYNLELETALTEQSFNITIKDKDFPIHLVTPEESVYDMARSEKGKIEFNEKIKPLLDELDTKLFWTDPAVWPIADAQLMTPFGVRSYNEDTTFSSRHTGIDLSTTLNAPVMTINNGTVIYSDELTETGHTIIIDHGLGLKSWYYHLSERLVEVGDIVAKGETIAKAGMTGNSTTAHLHLNLSVNSTYINPEVALNSPLFH